MTAVLVVAAGYSLWQQGGLPQAPAPQPADVVTETVAESKPAAPTAIPQMAEAVVETVPTPDAAPKGSDATPATTSPRTSVIVRKIVVKDQSGAVVFRGDVDLDGTLTRIERGERFPHRNDGGVFRNLEGRLPKKSNGYYREYVHPTPGLDGPGPQRIVMGRGGEVYYTADHYRTFQKIRP